MIRADAVIVAAADDSFVALVRGLLASLRDASAAAGEGCLPIRILDVGLSKSNRAALSSQAAITDVSNIKSLQGAHPPSRVALARRVKSRLPDLVPGFTTYLWIDADAWVQDWSAVRMLLEGSRLAGLAAAPEIDRGYAVLYQKASRHFATTLRWYADAYGREVARDLIHRPVFNSGVWAARADSALWACWTRHMATAIERLGDEANDQPAFNRAIYHDHVPLHPVPAQCNWVCCHALPRWDPDLLKLTEPTVPFQPLGIIHLTQCCCHVELPVPTGEGQTRLMKLDYLSVVEQRDSNSKSAMTAIDTPTTVERHPSADVFHAAKGPSDLEPAIDSIARRALRPSLIVIPVCGLFNRLRAVASAHRLARLTGRRLLVSWKPDPDCGARFSDLFENELDEISATDLDAMKVRKLYRDMFDPAAEKYTCVQNRIARSGDGAIVWIQTCGHVAFDDEPVSNADNHQAPWFQRAMRAWYRGLRPVAWVRDQVAQESASFNDSTVGVHIRRTDHADAISRSPDERFVKHMDAAIAMDPRTRFYLATDDQATEQTFRRRYGDRIIVHPKSRWHDQAHPRADRTSVQGIREALVDLLLLASTRRVLGSQGSTFSWAAGDMSTCDTRVQMV